MSLRPNVFTPLWATIFILLFLAAAIDRSLQMNWGLANEVWMFLGFIVATPVFWVFASLVHKFNLAYVRHTYGPEPTD